jgi:GR25 family glycosyltransferase involved in LPS biosynthesis
MNNSFKFLNEYYDHIYVLSVSEAEERRQLFSERLRGLDFSFFFGADKNEFTETELIEKNIYSEELTRKHHRYSKGMRPGEIACAWSHLMMYEDMLAKKYERVMIFEDDAIPDPERLKQIPQILSEIPTDCELLMWGWSKNGKSDINTVFKQTVYKIQRSLGILKWDHTVIKNLFAKPFSSHLKKAGFHDYTYAYAINRGAAEKLLQMQSPIQYIADNLLAHAVTNNLVNGYIVYPAAFLHDNLPDGTARDSYIR